MITYLEEQQPSLGHITLVVKAFEPGLPGIPGSVSSNYQPRYLSSSGIPTSASYVDKQNQLATIQTEMDGKVRKFKKPWPANPVPSSSSGSGRPRLNADAKSGKNGSTEDQASASPAPAGQSAPASGSEVLPTPALARPRPKKHAKILQAAPALLDSLSGQQGSASSRVTIKPSNGSQFAPVVEGTGSPASSLPHRSIAPVPAVRTVNNFTSTMVIPPFRSKGGATQGASTLGSPPHTASGGTPAHNGAMGDSGSPVGSIPTSTPQSQAAPAIPASVMNADASFAIPSPPVTRGSTPQPGSLATTDLWRQIDAMLAALPPVADVNQATS